MLLPAAPVTSVPNVHANLGPTAAVVVLCVGAVICAVGLLGLWLAQRRDERRGRSSRVWVLPMVVLLAGFLPMLATIRTLFS